MKREEDGPERSAGTSEEIEEIEDLEAPAETADEVLGGGGDFTGSNVCGPGPTRLE